MKDHSVVVVGPQAVMQMRQDPMVRAPALAGRVHVDADAAEMGNVVEELMPHFLGDLVALPD